MRTRKEIQIGLAALVLAASLAACGPAEEPPADTEEAGEPATPEEVARETREALDAARRLAEQERDELLAAAEDNLEALSQRVDALQAELDAEIEDLDAEARARWQETLTRLEAERAAAADRFQRLEAVSDEAWADVRTGFEQAYDRFARTLEEAEADYGEAEEAEAPADQAEEAEQ